MPIIAVSATPTTIKVSLNLFVINYKILLTTVKYPITLINLNIVSALNKIKILLSV